MKSHYPARAGQSSSIAAPQGVYLWLESRIYVLRCKAAQRLRTQSPQKQISESAEHSMRISVDIPEAPPRPAPCRAQVLGRTPSRKRGKSRAVTVIMPVGPAAAAVTVTVTSPSMPLMMMTKASSPYSPSPTR